MNNSYKKSWLKTILITIVAVLSLVLIVACDNGPSDQSLVDQAKTNLGVSLKGDDSLDNVTQNFTVATTVSSDNGNITITWESEDTNVISFSGSTGRVTRPTDNDKVVKITASLKLNKATAFKDFNLTVVKQASAEEAIALVEIEGATYDEETKRYTTTSDLTLPETSLGYDIVWLSSNENVIAVDGKVTRPSWDESDALVQLTASIGEEEKYFVVSVPKVEEKPTSDKLDDAYDVLIIPGLDVDVVRTDLELPSTAGTEGVTVTWVSSDPTLLSNDGKIVLIPDEETAVTLTATLSLDGETKEKVFNLRVAPGLETVYDGDINGLIEAAKTEDLKEKHVVIYDATIVALTKDGFIILDDSDTFLFVFTKTAPNPETYVVGNVYNVYGAYDNFYGSPQLKDWDDMVIRVTPSDAPVSSVEPTEVTKVSDYISSLMDEENKTGDAFDKDNPLKMRYIEVTAKVRVQGSGDYDVFLVDEDYDGPNINSSNNSPFTTNALMIYYQSNIETIRIFDDITITARFYLNARRSNNMIYAVVFVGVEEDIEFTLTTEQKFSRAINTVSIPKQIVTATTLNLVDKVDDVDITWEALEGASLIDLANGKVTLPATGNELLKLKATFSVDGETEVKEYSVTVGEPDAISIADAKLAEKGEIIKVKGVVLGMTGNNKISILDETGAIVLYGKNLAGADVKVGDLITVLGTKDDYNELHQIASYTVKAKEDGTVPAAVDINDKDLNKTDLLPYQSMKVNLENLIVSNANLSTGASYDTFTMTLERLDGEKISFRWESRVPFEGSETLTSIKKGDVVNVVGALVDWFNGPQLTVNSAGQVVKLDVLPDDVAAILASRELKLDKVNFEENGTLTLPTTITGFDGVTVSWALFNSDDEDLIDIDTGAVTVVPDEFHEVELIATVTKGEVDINVEFTIRVGIQTLVTYHETFDSSTLTGSYTNKTFIGVNGVEWDVVGGRDEGDFPIDGSGIMLRQVTTSDHLQGTFLNGLESFSFEYRKAFTGGVARDYKVDVTNDGNTVTYNIDSFGTGSGEQTDVYTFSKENLGLEGTVVVRIYPTKDKNQATFDNFKWSEKVSEDTGVLELDFSTLANDTEYVKEEKDSTVQGTVVSRKNANISASGDNKGIVLGIRSGTNWDSPYLRTKEKIAGVTKIQFEVVNWTTDAGYNLNYADHIYIQTSTDGETWTNNKDFKPDWDTGNLGLNTLTLELDSPSDVYIRLFVESAGTQSSTYQLRLIVTSMKVWTE